MRLRKETRWYDDACGTAHALELVGERWSLLIVRELIFGPRRFSELRASLPGISAKTLTERLTGLEAAGILLRRKPAPPLNIQLYELTPWGYEAEEVIKSLGAWAARSPGHDPTLPLSPASIMLSFRTMFRPELAGRLAARIGFRFGHDAFVARLADAVLAVERGEPAMVDALVTATPEQVALATYAGTPLPDGVVTGDRDKVTAFLRVFALPPKA